MTSDNIFGSLRGIPDVEFAALNILEAWMPTMLRVLERRHNLPSGLLREPPVKDSYIGAVDFESWQANICPMITVVVQPTGTTERSASGYGQWFEIVIGATVHEESEDLSRIMAAHYGTAIAASVAQQGSLGGIATRTELVSAATVELPEPDRRHLALARVTFQSFITGLVDEAAGPNTPTPPASPQSPDDPAGPWSDFPTVTSTPVTLVAHDPE